MSGVEFEDQNYIQMSNLHQKQKTDGLSGVLMKYRIVKSKSAALRVLIVVSAIFLAGSVVLFYKNIPKNKIIPFKDLPRDVQQKFPLPVQRLYEQKS